jgi:hypothetical protein
MLDKFLTAAIPEPVVCMGIRLRPYSLGASLLLTRFGSPFISGGQFNIDDLTLAVILCSQTWAENLNFISGRDSTAEKSLKKWREKLPKDFNFIFSSNLFSKYLIAASGRDALPIVECDSKDAHSSEAPVELNWMVVCMTLGQSLETILDQPYGLTRWLAAGYGESQGLLRIVNPIPERTPEQLEKDALVFKKIMEEHGPR